jgi:monoterpene epsilon-lactone hydrolase
MVTVQPLADRDAPIVAEMWRAAAPHKGQILGPDARPMFEAMLAATPGPENVRCETGIVGGVNGWWCRPKQAIPGAALLYLHGGGYMLGSAKALCNLAGHIAARAV